MTIKAIETTYNGYRFRSRLEARWAVFLDSTGEPWEYEKEGFELPSGRYLPDFWLPRIGMWLEIKGVEPTDDETSKCEELALESGNPVAICWGLPHSEEEPENCRSKVFCVPVAPNCLDCDWHRCYWGIADDMQLCLLTDDEFSGRGFLCPKFENGVCTEQFDVFDDGLYIRTDTEEVYDYEVCIGDEFKGLKSSLFGLPIGLEHVNKAKSARFEFSR